MGFDDIYIDFRPDAPTYNPDLRVTFKDGTVEEFQNDECSNSFTADPYDYAIQEGIDRVNRTVERYPIKQSHHIDVLSLIIPKDYSPDKPI